MRKQFLIVISAASLLSVSAIGFAAALLGGGSVPTETYFSPGFKAGVTEGVHATGKASQYLGKSCERSNDSYLCMMCNCMREAAGEPLEGKKLVGEVVKTRVQSGNPWPDTICDVIYQEKQFSWTIHQRDRRSLPRQMSSSMMECAVATDATINSPGNGMDHYHADYVKPGWARSTCGRAKKTKIGRHIFYEGCVAKSSGPTRRYRRGVVQR